MCTVEHHNLFYYNPRAKEEIAVTILTYPRISLYDGSSSNVIVSKSQLKRVESDDLVTATFPDRRKIKRPSGEAKFLTRE